MKKFMIIALILIISVVAFSLYMYYKPSKNLLKAKPDIVTSAKDFIKEYSLDETSGNQKYVGKIIEVRGEIFIIQSNEKGIGTIFLEDDFFGISCTMDSLYFSSVKNMLDSAEEGSLISIKGRCNGILTNIQMSSCVLVESKGE